MPVREGCFWDHMGAIFAFLSSLNSLVFEALLTTFCVGDLRYRIVAAVAQRRSGPPRVGWNSILSMW